MDPVDSDLEEKLKKLRETKDKIENAKKALEKDLETLKNDHHQLLSDVDIAERRLLVDKKREHEVPSLCTGDLVAMNARLSEELVKLSDLHRKRKTAAFAAPIFSAKHVGCQTESCRVIINSINEVNKAIEKETEDRLLLDLNQPGTSQSARLATPLRPDSPELLLGGRRLDDLSEEEQLNYALQRSQLENIVAEEEEVQVNLAIELSLLDSNNEKNGQDASSEVVSMPSSSKTNDKKVESNNYEVEFVEEYEMFPDANIGLMVMAQQRILDLEKRLGQATPAEFKVALIANGYRFTEDGSICSDGEIDIDEEQDKEKDEQTQPMDVENTSQPSASHAEATPPESQRQDIEDSTPSKRPRRADLRVNGDAVINDLMSVELAKVFNHVKRQAQKELNSNNESTPKNSTVTRSIKPATSQLTKAATLVLRRETLTPPIRTNGEGQPSSALPAEWTVQPGADREKLISVPAIPLPFQSSLFVSIQPKPQSSTAAAITTRSAVKTANKQPLLARSNIVTPPVPSSPVPYAGEKFPTEYEDLVFSYKAHTDDDVIPSQNGPILIRAKCQGCYEVFSVHTEFLKKQFISHCINKCEKYKKLNVIKLCPFCYKKVVNVDAYNIHYQSEHLDFSSIATAKIPAPLNGGK